MNELNVKNIQENFRRVYIELLFLLLLTKEDMYGFQLSSELKKLSNEIFDLKQGSLYAPLYRLIDNGSISEKKVPRGKRQLLSYYHIEPEGYKYLDSLLKEERKILDAVNAVKKEINYITEEDLWAGIFAKN